MKQAYYKNFHEVLNGQNKWRSNIYFGFPKEKLNVSIVREMMEKKYFSNRIILTKNLVVFEQNIENRYPEARTKAKKLFEKARMIENVIIFVPMSYKEYNVTKTAKNIIIEKNINEELFGRDDFISVHENKLSIETREKYFDISLELENINVEIEKMENERNNEIKKRILECLK